MRTPSCVAAVIIGQALSTQAQRSHQCSHTFRDFSPYCPATTVSAIDFVFANVGRALLQVLPCSNGPALSYEGTRLYLRRGNIHPNLFRNSGPQFYMVANQPFQQYNLIKTPP